MSATRPLFTIRFTLADALLGIETPFIGSLKGNLTGFTLADALLGIETKIRISGRTWAFVFHFSWCPFRDWNLKYSLDHECIHVSL